MAKISGQVYSPLNINLFRNVGIIFMVLLGISLVELFLYDANTKKNVMNQLFNEDEEGDVWHTESHYVKIKEETSKAFYTQNINNNIPAKDAVFQTVAGSRYKFFLYSAFYDARNPQRVVRVIGVTSTIKILSNLISAWCLLWNKAGNLNMLAVKATVELTHEHWLLNYSACFILCPLLNGMDAPHSVSIVMISNLTASNRLLVNNAGQRPQPTLFDKFGVCVLPLYNHYNRTLPMLEFIELNTILGMHHFTFYNSSISPTISCILNHYIREGRVSVHQWKKTILPETELRNEAMFVALNDCMYRSMFKFRYVALIDVDEVIIPRHNDTIQQLLNWLDTTVGLYGEYVFQNAFFYLQWPDDTSLSDNPFERRLNTLRKTRRRSELQPHNKRSKYICRPEWVIEGGNHFVWTFVGGKNLTFNVPGYNALLHHYRTECEYVGFDCLNITSLIDRTAHRYKTRLLKSMKTKWTELKANCSLPNIEDF